MKARVTKTPTNKLALAAGAALLALSGAPRAFAADPALLAAEDDWRRAATLAVQDDARVQGLAVPGEGAQFALVPEGRTLGAAPASDGSHVLYVSRAAHKLPAGLYQAVIDSTGKASLFYFDPARGRVKANLAVPPGDPAAFHTPLGDDMCRNAPDLIYEFCQTFVACAAYGFFC